MGEQHDSAASVEAGGGACPHQRVLAVWECVRVVSLKTLGQKRGADESADMYGQRCGDRRTAGRTRYASRRAGVQ